MSPRLFFQNRIWKFSAFVQGALAIRRIFSLVDMITKPKFSNGPIFLKNWSVLVVKHA